MIPRSPVYVAGPYAGDTEAEILVNVHRACCLARLAVASQLAPIVVHPAIEAQAYGRDEIPQERAAGLDCALALVELTARHSGGKLWILTRGDGSLSTGTARELEAWKGVRRGHREVRRGSWAQWCQAFIGAGLGDLWAKWAYDDELEACRHLLTGEAARLAAMAVADRVAACHERTGTAPTSGIVV